MSEWIDGAVEKPVNDGWILISSGVLPEEDQIIWGTFEYFATNKREVSECRYETPWDDGRKKDCELIAWKPSVEPEPYQGER